MNRLTLRIVLNVNPNLRFKKIYWMLKSNYSPSSMTEVLRFN